MWIKICGIRDVETAAAVASLGVDAIGLNFFDRSPRVVAPDVAARIVAGLPRSVDPVGVFVNHAVREVQEIARRVGLRTVQLHGDEPVETLAELSPEFRIIRAFRVGDEGLASVESYLAACQQASAMPFACLVDAKVAGHYGGTGRTSPWDVLHRDWRTAEWPPLILAGGLHDGNVAEAIQQVNPWGVDVAGGVESSPGVKEIARVREFVARARTAAG